MRRGTDAYVVIHTFDGELPEVIEVLLPEGCPERVLEIYAAQEKKAVIQIGVVRYCPKANWEAVAVYGR